MDVPEAVWDLRPYYVQPGWSAVPGPNYFLAGLVFYLVVFIGEVYLDLRQHRLLTSKEIPPELTRAMQEMDAIAAAKPPPAEEPKAEPEAKPEAEEEEEELIGPPFLEKLEAKFDKAQAYGYDKSCFGFVRSFWGLGEGLFMLLIGSGPFLYDTSTNVVARTIEADSALNPAATWLGLSTPAAENQKCIALVYFGFLMVISTITGLPFQLYSSFVIEERHGFNKQTLALFFMDQIKTLVLVVVLGVPILSTLLYIIEWGGPSFPLYVWAFMFVVSVFMMAIYPVYIAPMFNTFEPLPPGDLKNAIEQLAAKLEFPLTKLFVVDGSTRSSHSNAYMYGFFKNKRIVLFDTLIKQLDREEIVAVLGHELGHWKMGHTLQGFVIAQLHTLVMFGAFGFFINHQGLYTSFGYTGQPAAIGLILFSEVIWGPVDKVLSLLMNMWSRHNEFEADHFGATLGYAQQLQSGLVKMQIANMGNMKPDSWFSTYHYSHPPLVERLAALSSSTKKNA